VLQLKAALKRKKIFS